MDPNSEIKFLEKCRVAPPPDTVAEFTLPLTFYDLQFLSRPPSQHLHFYRFRHLSPNSGFIISSLKSSLSIVLKHFLPVAGNLVCPVHSGGMPELRYVKGDSVSLTIAESTENFDYLAGNHQKDCCKFNSLLPELQEPFVISGSEISPLFALQVTVFPNYGITVGRSVLHVLGDAITFKHFNTLWASIGNVNGDSLELLSTSSQPIYDRSVVQDPYNLGLKIYNEMKLFKSQRISKISNTTIYKHKVRTTFILHPLDIIKLKKSISAKNQSFNGDNVSSFTVVCAFIWTCLSKSLGVVNDKVEDDKPENLFVYINCRKRFDPPIPQNYFGNCVIPCIVGLTHGKLVGKKGLFEATYGIRNAIHKRVHNSEGILKGDWMKHTETVVDPEVLLIIVGSIQHELYNYNADFNWGVLEKHEHLSINSSITKMLIALSPMFHGAVELGISLPKDIMNAFTTIFIDGVNRLHTRSLM